VLLVLFETPHSAVVNAHQAAARPAGNSPSDTEMKLK